MYESISIAYGTAIGHACESVAITLATAESEYNGMKSSLGGEAEAEDKSNIVDYESIQQNVSPQKKPIQERTSTSVQKVNIDEQLLAMLDDD